HLSWFRPALLVDWTVILVLTLISIHIESIYPYERDVGHYLGDNDISWPHVFPERVSVRLLDHLAFKLPALLVVLISAMKLSLHDLHHSLLVLCSSRAIMRIAVEFIKNRVGRLRPDFLDRCAYSVLEKACTGPFNLVKDGRRSFPSGHSSTAFQGLFFLCLFIAGKNGAFAFGATFPRSGLLQSRLLRFSLAVSPLFLAVWICITRLEDHMHHPTDVLAGSTIGILSALAAYLIYYPSP
ncbi:phosphatidic acid phosphatase type 2/haloperoxidase, partial [Leucosporidium creatinivorum]